MKYNCQVIEDLLPLYIDGVLSDESRKLVEEHLKECQHCSDLLASMKRKDDLHFEIDEKKVLNKLSKKVKARSAFFGALILFLIVFLMIYFTSKNYYARFMTYMIDLQTHELFELCTLLLPVIGAIFLVMFYINHKINKTVRQNRSILITLLLFVLLSMIPLIDGYLNPVRFESGLYMIEKVNNNSILIRKEDQLQKIMIPESISSIIQADQKSCYQIDYSLNAMGNATLVKIKQKECPLYLVQLPSALDESYKAAYIQCLKILEGFNDFSMDQVRVHDTRANELELAREMYGFESFNDDADQYWTFVFEDVSMVVRKDTTINDKKPKIGIISFP